jgi:hypothetical protein
MNILGFLYIIIVALGLAIAFTFLFRTKGPWGSFWSFFAVLFFGIWAASLWITPFGPYWNDVYLLPPLAFGIILILLLTAAAPSPKSRARVEQELKDPEKGREIAIVGTFFWIFLAVVIAVIFAGLL